MSHVKKRPHSIDCSEKVEPSRTVQASKEECDINRIMAKYQRTGQLDFARDVSDRKYLDLAQAPTYHAAMNMVTAAQESFDALPSKIRSEFDNDPAKFLAFVHDPKNHDKAVELGLTTPAKPDPLKTFGDAVNRFAEGFKPAEGSKTPPA